MNVASGLKVEGGRLEFRAKGWGWRQPDQVSQKVHVATEYLLGPYSTCMENPFVLSTYTIYLHGPFGFHQSCEYALPLDVWTARSWSCALFPNGLGFRVWGDFPTVIITKVPV